MENNKEKGILLVLTTAFISGFSIFINKFGVTGIDPFLFTGLKNLLVAVFLFTLLSSTRQIKKLSINNWLRLGLIGLIGGSLPFLLFFKGLSQTLAPQASFIHKNMFLMVAFSAPILLKEKINKNFLIAGLFLLLGNAMLLNKAFPFSFNQGNFLILAAILLWALESLISKRVLKNLPSRIVAWGRMTFGSIFIFMFLLFSGRMGLVFSLQSKQWSWIFLTSLFLLAYVLTWYAGLKRLKASTAASVLVIGAPITSLLSVFSGNILTNKESLGIILVVLGIIILFKFKKTFSFFNARA